MKSLAILITCVLLCALLGCATSDIPKTNADATNQTLSSPTPDAEDDLTAAQILEAFKKANIPISDEVIFTEETDPNKLLNRPNQYTEKVSWKDTRMESIGNEKTTVTLEIFKSKNDLNSRKNYVEGVNKAASVLAQYIYVHKNALLRINHQLLPKQAEEYEKILKEL